MKFSANKSVILEGLEKASKGVAKTSVLPILVGILLKVTEEEVIITGSSNDMSIKVVIPVDNENVIVEKIGETVLQKKIVDIVKKLKNGDVVFETDEKDLTTITSNSVEFELPGYEAAEFPKLPEIPKDAQASIVLNGKEFQEVVRKTSFCAMTSDNRPILQSVMFDVREDCIHFYATDVHRLGLVTLPSIQKKEERKYPIPSKAVVEMTKVFDLDLDIELFSLSDTQAVFRNGNTIFTSRLLEGKYPEIVSIIPKDFGTVITLNRKELEQALEQMSVLVEEGNSSSVVTMEIEGLMMTLQSSASQRGKGKVDVAFNNIEGEPLTISYAGKLALDGVKSITSEEINLYFVGDMKPIIIKPVAAESDGNKDHLYMLSPVRSH